MHKIYSQVFERDPKVTTGKSWEAWFDLLDKAMAEEMSHEEINAMMLKQAYLNSFGECWAVAITVGYEFIKGWQVQHLGPITGFGLGAQKLLPIDSDPLWQVLTAGEGLKIWLGSGLEGLRFERGNRYETAEGTRGEISSINPGQELRLTWKPADWDNDSTLQLYLMTKDGKTFLRFYHKKLTGPAQRKEMKVHWQIVLGQIEALVNRDNNG
ncbi:MAG: SRPBCC domain-containing protein [Candidatus Promineifilaceae bacterium]